MIISYIYILIDPRNNKIRYVGQTINPDSRLNNHLYCSTTNTHKDNWVRLLIRNKLKPIMEIIDKDEYGEKSDGIEKFYINKFREEGVDLVNIEDGGISKEVSQITKEKLLEISKNKQPVLQYSLDGIFIQKFESAKAAKRNTGILNMNILRCCKEKKKFKSAGGFQWRYKKSNRFPKKIDPIKEYSKNKSVAQYDMDGNLIKIFISRWEASSELNLQHTHICACCSGRRKSCGGFLFKNI